MIRSAVVSDPIDVVALTQEAASPSAGATAIFLGTVREQNEGREVTGIEYSAYEEMAVKEMRSILDEACSKFGLASAIAVHRTGELAIGEASIAVVLSHAHRGPAMDALRYIVDETKSRAPVWKLEHYIDGSREWVGSTGARHP
ncbi:MAG TPA: molybdenum cofactor biosynthesis protein MoaE [Gemmatimonadaceae bacterium]